MRRTVAVWGVMLTLAGCTPALMGVYWHDVSASVRFKLETLVVTVVMGEGRKALLLLLLVVVMLTGLWLGWLVDRRRRRR